MTDVTDDGVSLVNISHPKPRLRDRLRFMFMRNRLNEAALETVEIEIRKPPERTLGPRQIHWCRANLIHNGEHIFTAMQGNRDDDRRQAEALVRHGGQPNFRMTLNEAIDIRQRELDDAARA